MNILITGACGQLGTELRNLTVNSTTNHNYIPTDVVKSDSTTLLNICDKKKLFDFVKQHNIEVIINCAAYTNVESAENEFDNAELLNSTAVRNLADAMQNAKGLLIHISTDYVFGGIHYTPIKESAAVNPTSVYGLTKLHGEQQIVESGCRYLIFRTAWLYSPYGKNF